MDSTPSQPQTETQRVNPLQILVNAAIIAYQRGAFSMKETSLISQSIDFFVETKQAIIPQPQPQQPQTQTQTPSEPPTSNKNLESIPEEKPVFVSQ